MLLHRPGLNISAKSSKLLLMFSHKKFKFCHVSNQFRSNSVGIFPGIWKFETATIFFKFSNSLGETGNLKIWIKLVWNYGNWNLEQLEILTAGPGAGAGRQLRRPEEEARGGVDDKSRERWCRRGPEPSLRWVRGLFAYGGRAFSRVLRIWRCPPELQGRRGYLGNPSWLSKSPCKLPNLQAIHFRKKKNLFRLNNGILPWIAD